MQHYFLGEEIKNPWMNASGVWCTSHEELLELCSTPIGAIVTKSVTLEARKGNPEPRFWGNATSSINSMGLPNHGIQYYIDFANNYQKEIGDKKFILSLAGLHLEKHMDSICNIINDCENIDAVELNLSCPNIPTHPLIAYNLPVFERTLRAFLEKCDKPVGVKLSPYFEAHQFEEVANMLNTTRIVFITTINSLPNGLLIDVENETPLIVPKNGVGGVGGMYAKPTTLANIYQFYPLLKKEIAIIGCGGILTGTDALEHTLCGASLLQVGTALAMHGISIFETLQNELDSVLTKKNDKNLTNYIGRLKKLV